jgi:regulator of replication initiation timing
MAEKSAYHPNPQANKELTTKKKQVDKKKHDDVVESNKRLRAENDQLRDEMKTMAISVAQLTWELHRYKTATKGDSDKFRGIKA